MRLKLWQLYALVPFYLALAIWDYVDLTQFEAEGGTRRVHRLKAFLYSIGGKWAVVGFWLLIGGAFAFAIYRFHKYERRLRGIEQKLVTLNSPPPSITPSITPVKRASAGSWKPPPPPSASMPPTPASPGPPTGDTSDAPRFLK